MYTHLDRRILYLTHPRTASTSIAKALLKIGFEDNDGNHHGKYQEAVTRYPGVNWFNVFTVVRNHFDLFVSLYFSNKYIEYDSLDFEGFIERIINVDKSLYWKKGQCYMYGWNLPHCTDIIDFDVLDVGLNEFLLDCELPPVELTFENVSPKRNGLPYTDFHTYKSRSMIERSFGREMEQLGYTYEMSR